MLMKKIAGIICLLLIVVTFTFAQGNKEKNAIREKIKLRKIGFITERLSLSTAEAQAFWPLYNDYHAKVTAIKQANRKPATPISNMTDAEVEQLIDARLEREANLLSMKRNYVNQLKTILPVKKIAKIPNIERKFKEWMLQQSKSNRQLSNR